MILVASAKKNSARGLNRLSKYAVLPMTIVTSSRYPVASHCTVASGTCMLRMSTGKSTVIEVSMRIPTKESMPMDAMAARVRHGTGESAASRFAGRKSGLCSVLPASFGCCCVLSGIVLLAMALSSFVVVFRHFSSFAIVHSRLPSQVVSRVRTDTLLCAVMCRLLCGGLPARACRPVSGLQKARFARVQTLSAVPLALWALR